jgi:cation-transporting P-type ATPase E
MRRFELFRRVLPSVGPIIFRNFFVLVNVIISGVVVLLFVFGNGQAGLFLGIVFLLNTTIAAVQDIRARAILEKLQMLTALRVIRINKDQSETAITAEEIKKGDHLKLKLGDQVPCESVLVSGENLEISEALITGESDPFAKKVGEKIIAGAIITSGFGVVKAEGTFKESRLSTIAEGVKKYAVNLSSIQKDTNTVIKYSGYALLLVLIFVVARGIFIHASKLEIVTNSGALASTLVPQGLVVAITLLFAIGAASYSKRDVLFQEINATEKLGRIKNICIDKTGTLTDNVLVVEKMHIVQGFSETEATALTYAYIVGSGDSSQTILAVKKHLEENKKEGAEKEIIKALPFSSWRQYGAVEVREGEALQTVFVGTPDIFKSKISNPEEKKWMEEVIEENAKAGKRVLCALSTDGHQLSNDLSQISLSVVAIFVFHNTLREGVTNAIKFFQDRKIQIRVLSGDGVETVRAVAESVGINKAHEVVSGGELAKWNEADFKTQANKYTVFAQVLPEHKVKLIEAFKKDGFTAMVGDGVNDALAMKKADLGIAMFDGVPITRQLAGVILMTNSFSDLPGAVKLADRFIRSIEISSGIYINQSVLGLFFFALISIFGFSYPLMPLNITFMNYFTVGLPTILISYWALRPSGDIPPANNKPFLARVMPLVFYCSAVQAVGTALVLFLSPAYLKTAPSNTLVGLSFIVFGFLFLIFAAKVYCVSLTKKEKQQLAWLAILEIVVFFLALQIPILVRFFDITLPYPSFISLGEASLVFLIFGFIQYFMVKKFFLKNSQSTT